jgi:DNA-binding winged helix-turn-helix (wHTH) protein/TolB-like protein
MSLGRFRFGLFEFNLNTRELRREGVLLRLQSQPAQVLACLVEHAGQAVTRGELIKEVWGADTYVDFDRGLNFCIGQIRSALDDDSVAPRFIRTLPKRGYQFIAPVERLGNDFDGIEAAMGKNGIGFVAAALVCAAIALMALAASAGYLFRSWQSSRRQPIVAVLRFDNQTNDPGMTRFSDSLTDNVVERLTALSLGKYDVIGNARILRLPRDQRNLTAIASSLHASYVVLGQVQNNGTQSRILVHLIRLPDQTHLWVARLDRTLSDSDSWQLESEAAQKVSAEFSERIVKDSSGRPLPEAPSH